MFNDKLRMYTGKMSKTITPEFSTLISIFEKFGNCEFVGGSSFKNKNNDIIEVHDISLTKRCFRVRFHEEDILCVIGPDHNMYFVNPWITALYKAQLDWSYITKKPTEDPIALNRLDDAIHLNKNGGGG